MGWWVGGLLGGKANRDSSDSEFMGYIRSLHYTPSFIQIELKLAKLAFGEVPAKGVG